MNLKKDFYWALVIIFVIACFVFAKNENNKTHVGLVEQSTCPTCGEIQENNIHYVKIAGQTVKVELALTMQAQAQGLSGRKILEENEGMLFVFKNSGRYSFWMKDMNFPIDIIWLDETLHIVYIIKNAEPSSYPNTFTPNLEAKYVLEVPTGFSKKNNLKEGDDVYFFALKSV